MLPYRYNLESSGKDARRKHTLLSTEVLLIQSVCPHLSTRLLFNTKVPCDGSLIEANNLPSQVLFKL